MNQTTKHILAVAGVIAVLLGVVGAIPSFLQNKLVAATGSAILMVAGVILLAISFGD